MFNKKYNLKVCLWLLLATAVFGVANASSFTERLSEIWVDVINLSGKSSISRYEITRLLNAVNCEDCVQAPEWMRNRYTINFWNQFKIIDSNNFDDINFEWWVWGNKSYYYCVAYVWENGLMSWYPLTSTKCQGNFCGQELVTTSEFQTIFL